MRFSPLLPLLILSSLALAAAPATEPAIIPRPSSVQVGEGSLRLDNGERIIVDDSTRAAGEYLAELLAPAMGTRRTVTDTVGDDGWNHGDIVLLLAARPDLGDEGYELIVNKESVLIT